MKPTQSISSAESSANPDPLTGEAGMHPVGTGAGALAGGAALAAAGSFAGPAGAAVGLVVGAVVGGLTGKGFAEGLDPSAEEAHWREAHRSQDYAPAESAYSDYSAAYWAGFTCYEDGRSFEEREDVIRAEFERRCRTAEVPPIGNMEPNESVLPLDEPTLPLPDRIPRVVENHLATRPLPWAEARPAARAAYLRMQQNREAAK